MSVLFRSPIFMGVSFAMLMGGVADIGKHCGIADNPIAQLGFGFIGLVGTVALIIKTGEQKTFFGLRGLAVDEIDEPADEPERERIPTRKRITQALQVYINSFKDKKSYSDQLKKLKSVSDKFVCPLSRDIPNIPVLLDGRTYDYTWIKTCKKDPQTRAPFRMDQLQADRRTKEEIEAWIANCQPEPQRSKLRSYLK